LAIFYAIQTSFERRRRTETYGSPTIGLRPILNPQSLVQNSKLEKEDPKMACWIALDAEQLKRS